MTLDELKNKEVSVNERANQIVASLGIKADIRTNVAKLREKDVFTLVNLRPANEDQLKKDIEAKKDLSFVALVFVTSNGGSIGVKQFNKFVYDEETYPDMPLIGSTAEENAKFLIYCVEKDIHFKVKKIIEGEEKTFGETKYTPKDFSLEVVEVED